LATGTVRRTLRSLIVLLLVALAGPVAAARVTLITHGYNASVDDWITAMANRMAAYTGYWGGGASIYRLTISTNSAGDFVTAAQFASGTPADQTASGNLFLLLDWSNVAGSISGSFEVFPARHTVAQIAEVVAPALLNAGLISDLDGRPVAAFPLHLIGHSRGGPLISETARLLGAHGVWVDQLTMLDPHPCDPTDFLEAIGCPVPDQQPAIFENVLFADNYWQNLGSGFDLRGQPVDGAYNRQLTSLPGGYSLNHSDTHLWYHATIDFTTPTQDGGSSLQASDRANWFAAGETNGMWAGFLRSQVGGGDRDSDQTPAGPGTPAIQEGLTGPRQALPANDGTWPNLLRLSAVNPGSFVFNSEPGLALREENVAHPGQTLLIAADYQAGQDSTWELFLDADANALNGNELVLAQEPLTATGINMVSNLVRSVAVDGGQVAYGVYFLGSRITAGTSGFARTAYAPQRIA
jgi:hypothetical protein